MAEDPPVSFPRVTPYLLYQDVASALGWLARAFGFRERLRFTGEDGAVNHAEMVLGDDGVIMLGSPGPDYRNPATLGATTVQLHVYVDDVEAHFAQARDAGARIVREPADEEYGDRRYDAEDLEGHRWSFAQHLRDVPPREWGAVQA
ncbi:MAG: VOC family protein [Euzebyales bacterium]|nr:VOC family protein [Euzebyales bacterium]